MPFAQCAAMRTFCLQHFRSRSRACTFLKTFSASFVKPERKTSRQNPKKGDIFGKFSTIFKSSEGVRSAKTSLLNKSNSAKTNLFIAYLRFLSLLRKKFVNFSRILSTFLQISIAIVFNLCYNADSVNF